MSVSSPCEICTRREVEFTCDRCGKLVCDEHFDEATGFCVECAAEVAGGDPARQRDPDNLPNGVDTYRS